MAFIEFKKITMRKNKLLILSTSSFLVGALHAQTVNEGVLVVSPGTQFSTVSDLNNTASGQITNDGEAFIYGHFNNDGAVNFTSGSNGYTRFEGNAVQQITGASTSFFNDVLFNNIASPTASFELLGDISIANYAEFQNGIVQNDGFGGTITFEENGDHSAPYDGSHVDGMVYKNGNNAFAFPVGDGQLYRYAVISAPSAATDKFNAKYFYQNADPVYPFANKQSVIQLIDDQEYWEVKRENGNSTVLLTLSWDELTTTPSSIVAMPDTDIHIVRWDVALNMWVDEGGVVDQATKSVTTPVALDAYGIFTLARVIKEPAILISEGLTPNSDGYNDVLKIEAIDAYPNTSIVVFNRWGTKVYESDDYQNDWSGTSTSSLNVGGDELPEGTYYYLITLGGDSANSNYHKVYKGYFYLKRK